MNKKYLVAYKYVIAGWGYKIEYVAESLHDAETFKSLIEKAHPKDEYIIFAEV